jgi:hypothetical protein
VKYDSILALGSPARAQAQLEKLDLLKALKTCSKGCLELDSLQPQLRQCIEELFSRRSYGTILSAYYRSGEIGPYSVSQLLRKLHENRDFPTLLKQSYRFNVYWDLKGEIDEALKWHAARDLPDTAAWLYKFRKLREQDTLLEDVPPKTMQIEEELPEGANGTPRIFELRPLGVARSSMTKLHEEESTDDPYIVSRTARAKLEQANALHEDTLQIRKAHLQHQNCPVSESKLMDAYAVLNDGPAIFEIKSINEGNEREQIRHALSQLYEYRYLHSMSDASLWIVFSQAPSSQWYIDYLAGDRGIRTVWISRGGLVGPSVHLLQ